MTEKNKIAFIVCVNSKKYYDECIWYIDHLHIPPGYRADVICVTEVKSMAEGYNIAMKSSDAKFKIYLHQDVFIRNRFFLDEILHIFSLDKKIGMAGMVGGRDLPKDAIVYNKWNMGYAYCSNRAFTVPVLYYQDEKRRWMEADAIDGMLMATQYDIGWREDLMLGWDFYDISQSMEFLRNGFKIAIPFQKEPWCIHDCGHSKLAHYDQARQKILEEYQDFFSETFVPFYNEELQDIQKEIFKVLKSFILQNCWDKALEIRKAVQDSVIRDNDLQFALNLLDIYLAEKNICGQKRQFFTDSDLWNELQDKYDEIKFLMRRVEMVSDKEAAERLTELIKDEISVEAVRTIGGHSTVDTDHVMKAII